MEEQHLKSNSLWSCIHNSGIIDISGSVADIDDYNNDKSEKAGSQYDYFMRGKDAETLEDVILDKIEEIRDLRAEDRSNKRFHPNIEPESESLIPKIWACQV